jgi:hypothetical protein
MLKILYDKGEEMILELPSIPVEHDPQALLKIWGPELESDSNFN